MRSVILAGVVALVTGCGADGERGATDVDVLPSGEGMRTKDDSRTVRTKDGGVARYEGHFASDDPEPPVPTEPLTP